MSHGNAAIKSTSVTSSLPTKATSTNETAGSTNAHTSRVLACRYVAEDAVGAAFAGLTGEVRPRLQFTSGGSNDLPTVGVTI